MYVLRSVALALLLLLKISTVQLQYVCTAPGTTASDVNNPVVMTPELKDKIVAAHNEVRNLVASGGLKDPDQPAATNMMKMEWNDDLAWDAQKWAEGCDFNHGCSGDPESVLCPPDKKTFDEDGNPDLPFGQNLAGLNQDMEFQSGEDPDYKGRAVALWLSEYNQTSFKPEYINEYNFGMDYGHYSQVVWAKTSKVGCGHAYFKKEGEANPYRILMVCNYLPPGNYQCDSIYKQDGECPAGTTLDTTYTSLCTGTPTETDPGNFNTDCYKDGAWDFENQNDGDRDEPDDGDGDEGDGNDGDGNDGDGNDGDGNDEDGNDGDGDDDIVYDKEE